MAARRKSRKKSIVRRATTTARRIVRKATRRRRSSPAAGGAIVRRRAGRRGGGNLPGFTTTEILKTVAFALPVGVGTAFAQDKIATWFGNMLTPKTPTGTSLGEKINGTGYARPLVKLAIGTGLAALVGIVFKQRKIGGMMLIGSATEAGLSALRVMQANRPANGGASAAALAAARQQVALNANPNRAGLPETVSTPGYAGGSANTQVAGLRGFYGATDPSRANA